MSAIYSHQLLASVSNQVDAEHVVDVTLVAERIRRKHEAENVAREDIETLVMRRAVLVGRPMLVGGIPEDQGEPAMKESA